MNNQYDDNFEQWFQSTEYGRPKHLLDHPQVKESIRQRMWNKIQHSTKEKIPTVTPRFLWGKVAAIIFLVGAITLMVYRQRPMSTAAKLISYHTQKGVLKKVLLPDSSEIWLNGGSSIRVPEKFLKQREVFIDEGEVFFQVRKDRTRPFVVHSGAINTTVVGTSFNIKAYHNDPEISVSVKTGLVKVAKLSNDNHVMLSPAQQVRFTKKSGYLQRNQVTTQDIDSWTTRRLHYKGASLATILDDLERQYDVAFHAETPKLLSCTYSVGFDNLPLDQVLAKLEILGSLQFKINKKDIYLKGKECR